MPAMGESFWEQYCHAWFSQWLSFTVKTNKIIMGTGQDSNLLLPGQPCMVIWGDRGDMVRVGQGVDSVDVPVPRPVETE